MNQDIVSFWEEQAHHFISWDKPFQTTYEGAFETQKHAWFLDGKLNMSKNCIDRHLETLGNQPAIHWVSDDLITTRTLTFQELYKAVCCMSNVFKKLGLKAGDVIAIYLPMIPEAAIAMLAAARMGAIHTVIFAGFSKEALHERLHLSQAKLLVTTMHYTRSGKTYDLEKTVLSISHTEKIPLLFIQGNSSLHAPQHALFSWEKMKEEVETTFHPISMSAEAPLFILYTSGSTGKPKGIVHTTGGYAVQTAFSHRYLFDCKPGDVFWCTADMGWITGHSYTLYGTLLNGVTTLMHAGTPHYPTPSTYFDIIDKFSVKVLYTAPTTIRLLKQLGDTWLTKSSRASLKTLGSVGEPISKDACQWYFDKVGHGKCPVLDTWWQTETGAIMLAPQKGLNNFKPGSAGTPLPGLDIVIIDDNYKLQEGKAKGLLAIRSPWPAMARAVLHEKARYAAYFQNGFYLSGDAALRDETGDYWLLGRVDDVLNVSGHRLGTAEIESALATCKTVAEAAVIGFPHAIKGEGIAAFVKLKKNTAKLSEEHLKNIVTKIIGALARPDKVFIVSDLPKTRSGKIMRRILKELMLRKNLTGDLSTLANPQSVTELKVCLNNDLCR